MSDAVTIYEVGPRDGLQNHPVNVVTEDKIRLIELLQNAGLDHIEVASFVNPNLVPQMADGAAVMAGLVKRPGDVFGALAPNLQGAADAVAAGVSEIAIFVSASEAFSQKNTNCSVAEGLERARTVAQYALGNHLSVRGYVSCVAGCPYEGEIDPVVVAHLSAQLMDMGSREVSLGDTIGRGTPKQIGELLDEVLRAVPATHLAGHFHDTGGRALENIQAAMERGVRVFDASIAGLGGCPFAPGASGNVDTGHAVAMLHDRGCDTGIDTEALSRAALYADAITKERVTS